MNINVSGQSLALFDTKLYSEKITFCDLLNKYVNMQKEFKYYTFGSSFYGVSSYDNDSNIFGNWSFVVRRDSLNQYGFSSLELPITAEWYRKLSYFADSTIKIFTVKFGKPLKETFVKTNVYQKGKKYFPSAVRKAMWLIDGQKLKVDFSIEGEHNEYFYLLKVERFKYYYGNTKLPKWWDGY
ncbi:hypothetical protein [Mucilaginibacter arboris]|uniref:Uncharacterized protein n=1 Tax=Mucilaginibacter arboris TaxID=2682090 RepID=A0A7K1T1M5_9SPHI|nr:hypothetical protein [Mucilaginibacter arboris]MVN23411.1 hypothetical protein [Mucilaginibacter arboris]